jgi:Flp pilus assembly protein TadB
MKEPEAVKLLQQHDRRKKDRDRLEDCIETAARLEGPFRGALWWILLIGFMAFMTLARTWSMDKVALLWGVVLVLGVILLVRAREADRRYRHAAAAARLLRDVLETASQGGRT